jgi:hypothetical protein
MTTKASDDEIFGADSPASVPALLRFALRVAARAQGSLPAGWLAFTGSASNPLDHYERFLITWSSPSPVLLTLHALFPLVAAEQMLGEPDDRSSPDLPDGQAELIKRPGRE